MRSYCMRYHNARQDNENVDDSRGMGRVKNYSGVDSLISRFRSDHSVDSVDNIGALSSIDQLEQ